MKTTYDPTLDALSVRLTDAEIRESEEVRPGIVFDYDKDGRIVGFEILDAHSNLSKGVDLNGKTKSA
ncbi:MAG TPA: DUF2283 domain-containing protein [Methylovirgula sp.]